MSIETQAHIGCLVINVSCGKISKALQREVEHHLQKCGVEWTCKRMKSLWSIALNLRNNDQAQAVHIMQTESIAYHKSTSLPKGNWGVIIKRFLNAQRPCVIRRYAAVLRFYTSLKLSKLTENQCNKALSSIEEPVRKYLHDEGDQVSWINTLSNNMSYCLRRRMKEHRYKTIKIPDSQRHADKLKPTSYYFSKHEVPTDLRGTPYSSMTLSLISTEYVPPSIDAETPCYEMRQFIRDTWVHDVEIGRVVALQEQGCKARVVAQPSAWLQLAFMPLHHILEKTNTILYNGESCVSNQNSGAYAAMQHMLDGHECYSIDLTSATDRFPRSFSIELLNVLGYPEYGAALEDVCKRPFRCDFSPKGWVQYQTGQPMGLYGSFPLFHLTNLVLCDVVVETAQVHVKNGRYKNPLVPFSDGTFFKVLGDDVIFSDRVVAWLYRNHLERLGVDVSLPKSFSGKVTEFAGFVVLETTKGVTAFRPYKIPSGNLITNPIQFLHSMGVKVSKLSKWWSTRFVAYAQTLGDRDISLSPHISDNDNGVNSIYRGDTRLIMSLSNRLSTYFSDNDLPNLSGNTKINRSPLFLERRPMDYYGYNEKALKQETPEYSYQVTIPKRISSDPLMRKALNELHSKEEGSIEREPAKKVKSRDYSR